MTPFGSLNRRDFLKLLQVQLVSLAAPHEILVGLEQSEKPFRLSYSQLPDRIRTILQNVPKTEIDELGYLHTLSPGGKSLGKVPFAQTLWNKEKSFPVHRLDPRVPWGIVLHWYGDNDNFDRTINGYLRGFDDLREIDGIITRTSAHFVVGDEPLSHLTEGEPISILQTQAPDIDGTPFLASHLRPLDHKAHKDKLQYFVRALYQLSYTDRAVHTLLQDLFDGTRLDPNMRTFAIEITGNDFENPARFPSDQKIANTVSVVWAIMKRYGIPASGLLGHNEIQLGKPDPGKKFLALIRLLVGVKALMENDPAMRELVFGQFREPIQDERQAVRRYFEFVRGYLVLITFPFEVFLWEKLANFWLVNDLVAGGQWSVGFADQPISPLETQISLPGFSFLQPENHEGTDLYVHDPQSTGAVNVRLVAGGECLFTGEIKGLHTGKTAIFHHRLPDGSAILNIYSNLLDVTGISIGQTYPKGFRIGRIQSAGPQAFLHFAVAYSATWETDLKASPVVPLNVGGTWIRLRYLSAEEYINTPANTSSLPLLTEKWRQFFRPGELARITSGE